MAINSFINARINKVPFKILFGDKIPLPVNLLLYRESTINPYTYAFIKKVRQLVSKVKSAMHDA